MSTQTLSRLGLFLGLLFLQALVLCQIRLLGCCMPMLALFYLVLTPSRQNRSLTLAEAFLMGLGIDITLSTPGMAAAALTLTAFVAPYLVQLFADPERPDEDFIPSSKGMGWLSFLTYAALLTLIFCTAYFFIEWCTFSQMTRLLLSIAGSTLLTLLLIVLAELLHRRFISQGGD
ncbi:MAG: rod shape-determining protein MreD [Bacteroidaceae bacterium]|nr:rod shape-determining protein MreD [Bacteroidaceae bacterium]